MPASARRILLVLEWVIWATLLFWLYYAFMSSPATLDIVVGAVSATAAAATTTVIRRALGVSYPPRAAWLSWLAPLPASIPRDTLRLAWRLLRTLVLRPPPPGEQEDVELAEIDTKHEAARRALGPIAISASPGTYVMDVRTEEGRQDTLVVHRLVPGPSPVEEEVRR